MLTAKSKAKVAAVAIYHATTKPLGRSAGRSSVAAAAYRAGVKLEDHRTVMVFDFTRRSGVVLAEIVAPAGAGELASDRAALWNAAEAAENRKDARTAREWILALPAELIAEQRADLARAFAHELVERYGVAVDVAIHAPSRGGDDRNHHAHLLCTTRVVHAGSMAEKASIELSDTKRKTQGLGPAADEISTLRERWGELANAALATAGQSARIDHRSLEAQQSDAFERGDLQAAFALDRPAQVHVGIHATAMDRRTGHIVSERGETRAAALVAAHRAAYSARRQVERVIDLAMPAAVAMVTQELRWAVERPARNESGESWAADGPASIEGGPMHAANGPAWAVHSPMRVAEGPTTTNQETMMGDEQPCGSAAELRDEINRRSRSIEQRLDDVPALSNGRARLRELGMDNARLQSQQRQALVGVSEADRAASLWRRKHPVRAMLAGIVKPAKLREIEANRRGWEKLAKEARDARTKIADEGHPLHAQMRELEADYRGPIEAEAVADTRDLIALRTELQALEAEQNQRQQVEQQTQRQRAELDQEQRQQREVAAARVAAFEAGRVSSLGASHCLQQAFNEAHHVGLVNWDGVAIRGCAVALASGNTPADCAATLVKWWPGEPARAPELIDQAKAQVIVDQVRAAIEAGREPATEGGRLLATAIKAAGGDAAARAAILPTYVAAVETIAADPALRDVEEKEKDRPAPRF